MLVEPVVLVKVAAPNEVQLLLKLEFPVVLILWAMISRQAVELLPKHGVLLLQLAPLASKVALGKYATPATLNAALPEIVAVVVELLTSAMPATPPVEAT